LSYESTIATIIHPPRTPQYIFFGFLVRP